MKNLSKSFSLYLDARILTIFFFGVCSGLPWALSGSTLFIWLKESGIDKTTIGLFALAHTPYTIKFLWAPLVDKLPLPILSQKLGQRRAWLLISALFMAFFIILLGITEPSINAKIVAFMALCLAITSSCFDIVLAAFRIEKLEDNEQGTGAAAEVFGWRIGFLLSGAISLMMSEYLEWNLVYLMMAAIPILTILLTLITSEPKQIITPKQDWLKDAVITPFVKFSQRKGWLLILLFILLFKFPDAFLATMSGPFYLEMQFSKVDIGSIAKIFGFAATMVGTIIGGIIAHKLGIVKTLWITAILAAISNLAFITLTYYQGENFALAAVISVENLSGGMSTVAAVALLSMLCDKGYSATQFALFSSIISFARVWLSSPTGWLADHVEWPTFFLLSTASALPAIFLLFIVQKYLPKPIDEAAAKD